MPFDCINGSPVIFIHIPKNAGTSIKKYFNLQESCHRTAQDFLFSINKREIPISLNKDADDRNTVEQLNLILKRFEKEKKHPFKESFKFSFVRSPWDRFASIYHYHKDDFGISCFDDIVNNLKQRNGPIYSPDATTILKLTQFQYVSIGRSTSKLYTPHHNEGFQNITCSIDEERSIALDYIGRVETLREDIININNILGVSNEAESCEFRVHERKSDNSNQRYVKMYKDFDSIYAVFDYYYEDVKNFGYTFSGYPNCEITKECYRKKDET